MTHRKIVFVLFVIVIGTIMLYVKIVCHFYLPFFRLVSFLCNLLQPFKCSHALSPVVLPHHSIAAHMNCALSHAGIVVML